ncbi:type 1 glutamine amidotransferase domain-containing protein [Pantoea sp. GL120224-02]|uniref:type 1 glutamine amidotransferase domain-containing protein n=1 Tax=Pantoea sp. GL120224-02 TaxID=1378084 RepID=UPI000BD27D6E|nr:type 1 glutamine amidotransferase domain-containing protein [Pantoea sp. GL120224-02]SNY74470.1 Putative intracellular protease/amidase [Pantoea sp. GL120224-02]
MKILMVLTSHDALGNTGKKTGFWLEEFAAPYFVFKDAGSEVVLASPAGGQPPLDPKSDLPEFQTAMTERFKSDAAAQQALANTVKLASIDQQNFDTDFYPGGHGPLWDLAESADSIQLIESFDRAGKPMGFVCHAPGALRHVKAASGAPLIQGKQVTGFTNSEEAAVELTDVVPFLIEDEFIKLGAHYQKGTDWAPFVVQDGQLITGQNPASSEDVAKALLLQLAAQQP